METDGGRYRNRFNRNDRFGSNITNNYPSYRETENINMNIDIDTPEELAIWSETQKWKRRQYYIGLAVGLFIFALVIIISIVGAFTEKNTIAKNHDNSGDKYY
jgi:hypothetical protein